jgi:molecular chaperone DnaK
MPQIEVPFNIDVNPILAVTANDLGTGKEIAHRIEKTGGLSKDEIEKMKRDAEAHAADDKKRREVIDLKNQGENLVYQTEKSLREYGEKVSGDVRSGIESALNSLKDALKSEDAERIKPTMQALTEASHKLAEEMYKSTAAGAGAPGGPAPEASTDRGTTEPGTGAGAGAGGEAKKDEDVIDAEYEVKE